MKDTSQIANHWGDGHVYRLKRWVIQFGRVFAEGAFVSNSKTK